MAELSDESYALIKTLCDDGDALAADENYPEALKKYWEAFDLVPEPKEIWEATLWILAAIGDANYLTGDYEAGRDNFAHAMHCPDAIGNPFLHMRLGQCQFELGNLDQAADELTRAYALEGEELFLGEPERYLTFLKTRIKTN